MSTQVSAVRLLTASGEIVTCSALQSPELFRAAQLSLGALGIISELTLQLCPAYRLHEKNWSMEVEECLAEFDSMERNNCHAEFFWVPAVDRCAVKTLNNTDEAPRGAAPRSLAPPGTIERYLLPERVDWSHRIFPSERVVKFNEMEFAVPFQSGPDCFREIRALMQGCHHSVIWAVEYRTQGADDLYLSPAYERDSVTLSVHQAAELSHDDFFRDVESIFRNNRGRPHWGKLHSHDARELSELYPAWENFLQVREQVDPDGLFLNDYLCGLLKGA
jgi:FAD/FMN-containing dehydrogenase